MPTASLTIGAVFLEDVVPVDPDFLDLMVHFCDIEQMQKATRGTGSYGHATPSRQVVTTTTQNVRCRLRGLTDEEIESTGRAGEIREDYILYVPAGYLPKLLRDPQRAVDHRVVNVRKREGKLVNPGPLDIQSVRLMAGEDHHYQLRLRKAS